MLARKPRRILDDYRLERILDPSGPRLADAAEAVLGSLTPPHWWPHTRRIIQALDPAHQVTLSMLRSVNLYTGQTRR